MLLHFAARPENGLTEPLNNALLSFSTEQIYLIFKCQINTRHRHVITSRWRATPKQRSTAQPPIVSFCLHTLIKTTIKPLKLLYSSDYPRSLYVVRHACFTFRSAQPITFHLAFGVTDRCSQSEAPADCHRQACVRSSAALRKCARRERLLRVHSHTFTSCLFSTLTDSFNTLQPEIQGKA